MALIPCPECGRQVSTSATSCPSCGCPVGVAQPTQEPQRTAAAEPNSEAVAGSLDDQVRRQLRSLNAVCFDGTLTLSDEARGKLGEIAGLCSQVVTKIHILGDEWVDLDVELLPKLFPNLREFRVDGGEQLTNAALWHFANMQSLTKLDLYGVRSKHISDRGLRQLTRLSNVQFITLPRYWGDFRTASQASQANSELKAMLEQALPNAVVEFTR
jgi:hypothetical protein